MKKDTSIPFPMYFNWLDDTPLGTIWIAVSENGLYYLEFDVPKEKFVQSIKKTGEVQLIENREIAKQTLNQIKAYLEGRPITFDVKIDWSNATEFSKQVREIVTEIPYGETKSYGDIAKQLGKPGSARAVGRANATNPIPIIIPCHRVIASNGDLQGYGGTGGIKTKRWLLDLERKNAINKTVLF